MYNNILRSPENTNKTSLTNLSVNTWADKLKKLGNELQETVKATEEEFLSIGSSLREFYMRAESISKMSSHIAHLLSGEEISESIHKINNMVTQMSEIREHSKYETEQRMENLKFLLNSIATINEHLEEIKTSIKSLKMLGITTRIYSHNSSSFTIVATDIKRLAADLVSKIAFIHDGLKTLGIKIKETFGKVFSLKEKQQKKAQEILDNSKASLSSLTEKHAQSAIIAKNIARLSEETSTNIAEVVKFLQFHDIISQQIGQIRDRFDAEHARLEMSRGIEKYESNAVMDLIEEMGAFCSLQANQLIQYRDKMISAVDNIVENLRTINRNIMNISREVKELAGETKEKKQSFLSETKNGISAVTSAIAALAENAKMSKEMSQSISSIIFDEISAFLPDIKPIEDEIELLAFNAAITAANMEKGGEILDVISESVQKLSREVRSQTDSVIHIFRSMTSISGELSANVDAEEKRNEQIYTMTVEFESLTNSINRANEDIASNLAGIDIEVKALSEEIDLAIEGIYISDMVSRICNKVISEMNNIMYSSNAMVPELESLVNENIPGRAIKSEMEIITRKEIPVKEYAAGPSAEKNETRETPFADNIELF